MPVSVSRTERIPPKAEFLRVSACKQLCKAPGCCHSPPRRKCRAEGSPRDHGWVASSSLSFPLCLTQVELLWGRGWFPPGLEMSAPPAKCWVVEGTLLCIPPGSEASPHPPSPPLHSLLVFKSSHWLSQEIGCLSSAELQRAPTEPGNPGERRTLQSSMWKEKK